MLDVTYIFARSYMGDIRFYACRLAPNTITPNALENRYARRCNLNSQEHFKPKVGRKKRIKYSASAEGTEIYPSIYLTSSNVLIAMLCFRQLLFIVTFYMISSLAKECPG